MVDFGNRIKEERQFTNPTVRFIRKRGRIIPIINKRKIGRTLEKRGNQAIGAGLTLASAGLVTRKASSGLKSALKKRAKKFSSKRTFKVASFFGKKTSNFILGREATFELAENINRARDSGVGRAARATGRGAKALGKFALRNSGKLGIASVAIGLAAKAAGAELQLKSKFGLDVGAER